MAFDWSSIMGGGGDKLAPATEAGDYGMSTPEGGEMSVNPDAPGEGGLHGKDFGKSSRKGGLPGGGGGGGSKAHDQPATPGGPNLGGGPGPGTQGWEKSRTGTSPPLPWENRPSPTVPKMADISGGQQHWSRSGYHALPDPDRLLS